MKIKKTIWFALALLIAALFAGWKFYKNIESRKISWRHVEAITGPIELSISSSGTVSPQNRLEIKPPIAGRIEEILASEGQYVKKGTILAWMSSTDRAALLDAARAMGEQELSEWKTLYKATPVLAPLSGLIIASNIVLGQTVTTQDVLLVLSDRLIVRGQVDETDLAFIKKGAAARIVLDAFPSKSTTGKVHHIAWEAKTVNNVTVYEVEVLPDRQPDFMRSGMSATLTFIVDSRKSAVILPSEAVIADQEKFYVLLPDSTTIKSPRKKEVITGINNGKYVEIISGISKGEKALIEEKAGSVPSKMKRSKTGSSPLSPFGARPH